MCGIDEESKNHSLFECSFAAHLWQNFCGCFGVNWPGFDGIDRLMAWWKDQASKLSFKSVWLKGFVLVPYFLWLERNRRKFDGVGAFADQFFDLLRKDISSQSLVHSGSLLSVMDLLNARSLGILGVRHRHHENFEIYGCPPQSGWVKLNTNGCSIGNPRKSGARGVLRNEKAKVVGNFRNFLGTRTNLQAEFLAIMISLEVAQ
ncbi:uncharacterized protein LOC122063652 [Macadamia integrifolia]|uniref:uncharacterized protein LOC122063652 n=1 Tax=Macadamia integrifolia TaxID=60698 RepID=UPI001C4FE690|nr:uncharacterized protein LOC122063652 [Macadamia integrifolia]